MSFSSRPGAPGASQEARSAADTILLESESQERPEAEAKEREDFIETDRHSFTFAQNTREAIRYRVCWSYIDERDHASKSTFNLMLQLTRLDLEGGAPRGAQARPILTLPVGR